MDNQGNVSNSAKMKNNPYNYVQNENTFGDWTKCDQVSRERDVVA